MPFTERRGGRRQFYKKDTSLKRSGPFTQRTQPCVPAGHMQEPRNPSGGKPPKNNSKNLPGPSSPQSLSGPLNRSNAILSLLQPLDRYVAPSAIGSAIGRPLSRPISHPNTGGSPQPPRSKPLEGARPRDSGAIVSKTPFKTSAKQKRDRGCDSQPRPRPRLISQPQGATKRSLKKVRKRTDFQESPRQTKPNKGRFASRFANLGCLCEFGVFFFGKTRRIHKKWVQFANLVFFRFVNSPCFFPRKPLRIHKNTPNSRTGFRISLSLVWFCQGDS